MVRRGFPAEFRRRVIDLVEGGRKLSEISKELGNSQQTIYVWRRQARIDAGVVCQNSAYGISQQIPQVEHTAESSTSDDFGTSGPS